MGLLNLLGLDDLADSVNDLTSDIQGLRDDIIESVVGPGEDLKNTATDIVDSIKKSSSK